MASSDFIYDFIDKSEEQNMEYLLITLDKGKKIGKIDVFYSLKDKNSLKMLAEGLDIFNKKIGDIDENFE